MPNSSSLNTASKPIEKPCKMSIFTNQRRPTVTVTIGDTPLGAEYPVRVQSMTSTSTMDTKGSIAQCQRIIDAGAHYVRLTAQGVREAENLGNIRRGLHAMGYTTPLVADIHFNPKAAEMAATQVEKVRINPGNFVDPGRTFRKIEFTDEEYAAEINRIEQRLLPFIELCRANNTAIRIGVNHGSLSDRIMSRYGDTPAGMAESAMEFLRVFVKYNFLNVVISIKASNTVVMVETVRRLVEDMDAEDMHFPLHLGVTEAGNGEDGRIKSAVGIGTLLNHGIGDTIRVSLSEEPEMELPVARALVDHCTASITQFPGEYYPGYNPVEPQRRPSRLIGNFGGENTPVALHSDNVDPTLLLQLDASMPESDLIAKIANNPDKIIILAAPGHTPVQLLLSRLHAITTARLDNPVIVKLIYDTVDTDKIVIEASADLGTLLIDGFRDGIAIETEALTETEIKNLELNILQAARLRFTKTEYISCPGCGRTMFDLQTTVNRIKAATSHLPMLKIGVMGCIVNGPGEMADADYGYVGAGVGKVSLYKGKECVEKNIPEKDALDRLISLLKEEGKWIEPK